MSYDHVSMVIAAAIVEAFAAAAILLVIA